MGLWLPLVAITALSIMSQAYAETLCEAASNKALTINNIAVIQGQTDILACKTGLINGTMNQEDCARLVGNNFDKSKQNIQTLYRQGCKSGDLVTIPSKMTYLLRHYCDFKQAIVQSGEATVCVVNDGTGLDTGGSVVSATNSNSLENVSPQPNQAFNEGLTDRGVFQKWIQGLDGDVKAGAEWWAANRVHAQ